MAGSTVRVPLSDKRALGGVPYSVNPPEALVTALCAWLRGPRDRMPLVGYVNPHVHNLACEHADVRAFLDAADIVTVDGIGTAIGALLLNGARPPRLVMTTLVDRVLAAGDLPSLTAVLVGGDASTAERAAAAMTRASRRVRVVAWLDGYQGLERSLAWLRAQAPFDLLLVGMGTPASERLLLAARADGLRAVGWHVGGGTVHYYAGTRRRAPAWVSAMGMQWAYRMVCEPHTISRYVVGGPRFALHLLRARLGGGRPDHRAATAA